MKSLRERLAQFDRSPRAPSRASRIALDPVATAGRLGFEIVAPGHWLRRETMELAIRRDGALAGRLAGWDALPEGNWAILDTETTGLESGTGTLVFLVAILRLAPERAELQQHFLADLVGEAAMLDAVAGELADCSLLLSYNGKSFDLPRLRSRMALHRLDVDALDAPHLDLVHPLRRLGRDWLPDVRLATVEREVLDIHRVADIPGALVPTVYRDWLQQGEAEQIEAVMRHNRLDVVHLVALWDRVAAWLLTPGEQALPAPLRLGLGRLLELRRHPGAADLCYARAAADGDAGCRRRALWGRARLARRRGDHAQARQYWEMLVREHPAWIPPRVELAKLFEHRLRDLGAAREQTEAALRLLADDPLRAPHHRRADRERLLHRLRRLDAKAARGSVA